MDKIPLIRYFVGILKETINPIDTQFINNESHSDSIGESVPL